ncbi:DUF4349 domain-containing protein [Mucilaginibacter glaciei]|uniref:DUF4349 domain-containing protein n=1 Tax=Mucilaginibacter glaciei TaxID=2772109 RepID=A0A926NS19_9SPHI|nr:DUF4349 domain-containing protein [Mucilaginibacter glaciei]MBD1394308.1 DUF4349 domain-containing protein [Mucilaginibacter glaciei]
MKTKAIILLAGVALLAACKGKQGYEFVNNKSNAADTTAMATDSTGSSPKLIKTAEISFKVKSVQKTGDTIAALTARYNGMVMHHQMTSGINNSQDIHISDDSLMRISAINTSADMNVKIPSEKLELFMNQVSHLGLYITARKMDIEDKSLEYLSAKLKVHNRQELVAQQKKGKITIKDPSAVLWLKDDLVDGQIGNQQIDQSVKYSMVTLNFYQSNTILKEMIANDDPAAYQLPFAERLLMAFANGWFMFTAFIIGLANLWMLLLFGLGLWMLFKMYKKRYPVLKA